MVLMGARRDGKTCSKFRYCGELGAVKGMLCTRLTFNFVLFDCTVCCCKRRGRHGAVVSLVFLGLMVSSEEKYLSEKYFVGLFERCSTGWSATLMVDASDVVPRKSKEIDILYHGVDEVFV